MCRACSGKWAGSNPGARCPSQRGAARREYQNARNARARQRREADGHFGETPQAAEPLAGTDLASMPVAEFLDQATPQQVVDRFADTSSIWTLTREEADRVAQLAKQAVPEARRQAKEAFDEITMSRPREAVYALAKRRYEEDPDDPRNEVDEHYFAPMGPDDRVFDPDTRRYIGKVPRWEFQNLMLRYKEELKEAEEEHEKVMASGRYESSIRGLGTAVAVTAMADVTARISDGKTHEQRVEEAERQAMESEEYKKILKVEEAVVKFAAGEGVFADEACWDELRKAENWRFPGKGKIADTLGPSVFGDVVRHMNAHESFNPIDDPERGVESAKKLLASEKIRGMIDADKEEVVNMKARYEVDREERLIKDEVLRAYIDTVGEFVEMASPGDWTMGSKYRGKKSKQALEAMSQAMGLYPKHLVEKAEDTFRHLRVVNTSGRAHFSPTGEFKDHVGERQFVQIDGEYNRLAVPPTVTDNSSRGTSEFSDGTFGSEDRWRDYFAEDTTEGRKSLREKAKAYNEIAKEFNKEAKNAYEFYDRPLLSEVENRFSEAGFATPRIVHEGSYVERVPELKVESHVLPDGRKVAGLVTKTAVETITERHYDPYILVRTESIDGGVSTAAHEFGHVVEHSSDRVYLATKQFLDRRTRGLEQRQYKYGRSDEMVVADGFTDEYIGKIYNQHGSTEVFTMGMESLVHGEYCFSGKDTPTQTMDPEHRDLILGILAVSDVESSPRLKPGDS